MKFIHNPTLPVDEKMYYLVSILQRMGYPLIHIWLKYYHSMDDNEIESLFCSPQIVNMRDYNDNIEKICIEIIKNEYDI